jgi:predicted DNA-binding transcriptional regulator YafY
MHLDTDDIYYATHFVLSLGGSAEVLEPSALREMVMKEAESILARYKN